MIFPVISLIIFIGGGIWGIYSAFTTGDAEYGYKYYPSKFVANRKKQSVGFWWVVGLYASAMIACIFFLIDILTSN